MKLDDVLQQQAKSSFIESQEDIYHMIGGVGTDSDPNVFRFYPNPDNMRFYFLISKSDVIGEVYQLTELEMAQKGFVNANTFRIAIKHGTKVRSVKISLQTIGETISAETSPSSKSAKGGCKSTSGCSSGCCTEGGDGECYCDRCCIA